MPDRMEAITESMVSFANGLKNPPGSVPTVLPSGAGGAGMPESAGLRKAMVQALQAADSFAGDVDQGFNSFKALAIACHNDYEQNDGKKAADIARIELTLPGQTDHLRELEVAETAQQLRQERMGI
jgi:hypothetical protein